MVEPSAKKWTTFAIFVLPCFVLYLVFFITPFINGVGISFTNWDGLTNKAPMSMSVKDFEDSVLNAIKRDKNGAPVLGKNNAPKKLLSDKNREYLLSIYKKEGAEYKRSGIQGFKKFRVEQLIKKSGYENKNYKFVGGENYRTIFTGKADENFYPSKKDVSKYNRKSSLPFSIQRAEFENEIIDKDLTDKEIEFVCKAYRAPDEKDEKSIKDTSRKLNNDFNEVEVVRPLKNMKLTPVLFKRYTNRLKKLVRDNDTERLKKAEAAFIRTNSINKKDTEIVRDVTDKIIKLEKNRIEVEKSKARDKNKTLATFDNEEDFALQELEGIDIQPAIVTNYISKIQALALDGDDENVDNSSKLFIKDNGITDPIAAKTVELTTNQIKDIAKLKLLLEKTWVVTNYRMGVIGFTLFFAVFSVLGINILAFALALALDTGIRGQKILRTIYFLPNVLSMIIVALIWNMLFSQLLPNITGVQKWMMDPNKAPWLLVLVATWQGAGYYMIIYLAGLQNIPTDIIEAAMIDGATWKQRFLNITLPMMIPSLTISLFLTIANAFKSFDLMYAMVGQSGYATGTVPIVYDIFFQAYTKKQAGMATAEAMLLFFVIVLISGIQLYVMKKKEVEA